MKNIIRQIAWLAVLIIGGSAQAAPQAELWTHWQAHNEAGTQTVDHSAWDQLLQRYVTAGSGDHTGINLFGYAAVTDADRAALQAYLQTLADTDVAALPRAEQRAYWINLYNALTVEVILQHYPVDSIRDISGGFLSSGPWGEKRFTIGSEQVSLDDIEHRILRPIWQDARLHYAVNCASLGCPNLARRAFTADNTDQLLDAGAVAYVNHPRGARVENGALTVSSIYDWFKVDFGGDDAGVIAHLRQYGDADLKAALKGLSSISDDDYDWSLNETR